MPQFDWLCDVCRCVISPTSSIYWVELGFINTYNKPQLWLVLWRYSVDVTSTFPWVVTHAHIITSNLYSAWESSTWYNNLSVFYLYQNMEFDKPIGIYYVSIFIWNYPFYYLKKKKKKKTMIWCDSYGRCNYISGVIWR